MCHSCLSVRTREAWPELGTHCQRQYEGDMTDGIMQQPVKVPAGDHLNNFMLVQGGFDSFSKEQTMY